MADSDSSLYTLRYNLVSKNLEASGGNSSWDILSLKNGTPAAPAGTSGQVQFNNSGAFGASSNLRWSTGTNSLSVPGGQVVIGTASSPAAAQILRVDSTTKYAIFPRMTNTQRDALAEHAEGALIYSLTDHTYEFWNGSAWKQIATV